MNSKMILVAFGILFTIALNSTPAQYGSTPSCSSQLYLTLYNNAPANASVGVNNITLSAYLSKFVYSNASAECVFTGVPNGNVSFYITSINYYSRFYNTLFDLGNAFTNSTGYATISYNSSRIGPDTLTSIARWYGNSTQSTVQSNNRSVILGVPVARINTTCISNCKNTTVGKQIMLTSRICVGNPPFSWSTCTYLSNQKLSYYASQTFIGSIFTNSTGIGPITVNTVLLEPGIYDMYAIWRGGIKYANATASSQTADLSLNLYAAPKSSTTTTPSTTTITNSSAQASGSQSNQAQASSTYTYAGVAVVVVIILIIAAYLAMRRGKKPAVKK